MIQHPLFRSVVLAGVLVAASGAPASAQIYTWRNDAGQLVLSNKRPTDADSLTTYAVPEADGIQTPLRVEAPPDRDDYSDLIAEQARRNNVRQSLVRAVIQVESAFNPSARSPKGAMGLMQLMPATAREFGVRDAFNPEENVKGGVAYLRWLLDRYDGDEALALAAYNAGPGAVDRYGESVPPYAETTQYVSKVHRIAGTRQAPAAPQLYRTVDVVDGREIIKYTDRRPR